MIDFSTISRVFYCCTSEMSNNIFDQEQVWMRLNVSRGVYMYNRSKGYVIYELTTAKSKIHNITLIVSAYVHKQKTCLFKSRVANAPQGNKYRTNTIGKLKITLYCYMLRCIVFETFEFHTNWWYLGRLGIWQYLTNITDNIRNI